MRTCFGERVSLATLSVVWKMPLVVFAAAAAAAAAPAVIRAMSRWQVWFMGRVDNAFSVVRNIN